MKARAPIIKDLHYTKEQIAEVKRIQSDKVITRRKDRIRELLLKSLCCICSESVPTKRVEYNFDGTIRIETYCDEHFAIYERNKNISINDIAEMENCTRAPEGYFGRRKYESEENENKGYSLTPKSTGLHDSGNTIICSKCRVTRICFNDQMRGHNNTLIPLEYNNNLRPHDCDYSYPFRCQWCDAKLVFNRKIRTDNGRLVPLHFEDDVWHVCPKKPNQNRNRNIDDV